MTNKGNKTLILFLFFVLIVNPSFAFETKIGAKATSMGDAFFGLSNDSTLVFWNPAGAYQMKESEISVGKTEYETEDLDFLHMSFILPIDKYACGVGFSDGWFKDWKRDLSGNVIGTYEHHLGEMNLMLSYQLNDKLAIGGILKNLFEQLDTSRIDITAVTVGAMFIKEKINIGTVIKNIGYFKDNKNNAEIDIGLYYKGINNINLLADVNMPMTGHKCLNVGGEINLLNTLFIRAGNSLEEGEGWQSLKLGLGFKAYILAIDYTAEPYYSTTLHRITIRIRFPK